MLKEASGIQLNLRSNNEIEKMRRVFMKTIRRKKIRLKTTLNKYMNNN